ncbi:MAG: glycosyltransferase [Deltaproteobacteria bacterium]|nr:glycosyltransferase [Deltaproteobacteria bacterium]
MEQVKLSGNYILLQSEIITGNSINNWRNERNFTQGYLPLLQRANAVWECVESNIGQLRKLGIHAELLRFGYHPAMEEIVPKRNKDIDFLFCGSVTPHRKELLEELQARGGKIVTIFDDAAIHRNDLIARTRVNLAPNQGPGMNHFGASRVLYLINNRSMVVVDRCHDQGIYEHFFPSADSDHWVDLCMETLRRPDLTRVTEAYYERFKEFRMVDLMRPLLEEFATKYKSSSPLAPSGETDHQMDVPGTDNTGGSPLPQVKREKGVEGLISIIIPTHNRLAQTKKCVDSIHKKTPEFHEIIFVDHGSSDGTVRWLRGQVEKRKNYRLIETKQNLGVAWGCNQGIEESKGELILLLNSDIVVTDGWLTGMLACLGHTPHAGIVGPMTDDADGLQQISAAECRSGNDLDRFAAEFRAKYRHRRVRVRNLAVFCMLFRRALVEQIGILDEDLATGALGAEDFCLRSALERYQNYIAGDVFVHRQGSSIRETDDHASISGSRKVIERKWTLSTSSPEGKKLAVLKATELADDLHQRGKTDQAAETLIQCIKLTPDAKAIYHKLASIFMESKKFSEAWEVIESMPEAARNELKGLECAGYSKEGLGQDEEAAAYAERMLSLDGRYSAALNLKGILAYKKGEKEKAEGYFRAAMDNDPGYGEAHTNLGVLHWGMDKKDEGFARLKEGFVLSPTVPDASSLYYSAVSAMGAYHDAEADFLEAARLYPSNKNLAFLSIDILIRQAKFESAMSKIEDALAVFDLDQGILDAALSVRDKIGPLLINKASKRDTLSLCMIVKNEEQHLVRCLKSIRDIVDEIIVVDTGSTDKTKEIARVFGARVFDFPWTGDFAAARNHSLAQATGHWILILDADEVLSPLDFKELKGIIGKKSSSPAAYIIKTRNYVKNVGVIGWTPNGGRHPEEAGTGWVASSKVRLFERSKDVYFSNRVHEVLETSLKKANIPVRPCNITVHHYGKLDARKDLQKGEEYYMLGRIKHESDPTNMKYILELAKQSQVLNKYEEAVELWLKLLALLRANPDSSAYKEIARISYGEPVSEIYIQLAAAYLMLDRYEDALEAASKSLEGTIRLKEYVRIYAHCEIIAGSLSKAFGALEELLKEMPDYPPALILMAVIFCLEGQGEKAQEFIQLLLQKRVQVTPVLNNIARQFRTRGKTDEALTIVRAAIANRLGDQETMGLHDALIGS